MSNMNNSPEVKKFFEWIDYGGPFMSYRVEEESKKYGCTYVTLSFLISKDDTFEPRWNEDGELNETYGWKNKGEKYEC